MCDSVSADLDSERIGDGEFGPWLLWRPAAAKKGRQALERIGVRVSAGVRELADNRAEKVGLARFFRNKRVTVDQILQTAAERTGAAAAGRCVLLIEDASEINYEAKAKRKRGLGRVGNGADVGLFVHPALAVDAADGAVLGLAGATIWRRQQGQGGGLPEPADRGRRPARRSSSSRRTPLRSAPTSMGWRSAANFSFFLSPAVRRTRSRPWDAPARLGSGARSPVPRFPRSPPLAPPAPPPVARLRSSASQQLMAGLTSHARSSSATAPRLPDADRSGGKPHGRT